MNSKRFFIAYWLFLSASICAAGARADGLGDMLHTSRLLQAGYQGGGIRVGVISNGANGYADLAGQQVLPTGVQLLGDSLGRGDEGDWMLQIVHQIAPQAQLGFCPSSSPDETVACANALLTRFDANVIVDDVNPEPVSDSTTVKAAGLADLAARHPNALFFTGAGNNGGGYYEGVWRPIDVVINGTAWLAQDFRQPEESGPVPYDSFEVPPNSNAAVLLDFGTLPVSEGARCAADNPDETVMLLDMQGRPIKGVHGRCATIQLEYSNTSPVPERVQVAALLPVGAAAPTTRVKLVVLSEGPMGVAPLALRYRSDGAAGNSATAPGLIAVGSVDPNSRLGDRYLFEAFSNSGPQCQDYSALFAGQLTRLEVPRCLRQPAFVVPDRIEVSMWGPEGVERKPFVGDSAAGPAAAGVAALLLSAHIPAGQVLDVLEKTAIPQGNLQGWNPHFGYGLLDADAAAVTAGALPSAPDPAEASAGPEIDASQSRAAFARDQTLAMRAHQGDPAALRQLQAAAENGNADAQAALAQYSHQANDDLSAALWARRAATQGEPFAQSFLGSLYNRGWGVPMDPRAAQAWWWRASRAGVAAATFNMGTTLAAGRGAIEDPVVGYALMRAAILRGFQFPDAASQLAALSRSLPAAQGATAEGLAARFAQDPTAVPMF